jgi:hypothetical protein
VTKCAILGEIATDMIRVVDPFVIIPVASNAISGEIELVTDVAVRAAYRQVRSPDLETGRGQMIERGVFPGNLAVANLAIRGESHAAVVRVRGG